MSISTVNPNKVFYNYQGKLPPEEEKALRRKLVQEALEALKKEGQA